MYCQLVWSFCSKTDMSKLEKLQCRALRFVSGDFAMRSSDLLNLFDISPLSSIAVKKVAIALYKCINDISPKFLCNRFTVRNLYNLRGKKSIYLRSPNTTSYGIFCFSYLGAKVWNKLSNDVKNAATVDDFSKCIYSPDVVLQDDLWSYIVRG